MKAIRNEINDFRDVIVDTRDLTVTSAISS